MQHPIDFTNCVLGYRNYGGSDTKISIEYQGAKYMLKFPETISPVNDMQTSTLNNVFSEYIGSHVMQSLGIPTHETLLGVFRDEPVVACKDFTGDGYKLQEFSWFMRNMYRKEEIGRIPTYRQINEVMQTHSMLQPIAQQALDRYWDTFVGDALIGNFDRHKDNWGYLVNEETHEVKPAPVYDCGSCLYPGLTERMMKSVMEQEEEVDRRLFLFPKAALNKTDNVRKPDKFAYHELLSSGIDQNCTNALVRVAPRIDMNKISEIIHNTPMITKQRAEFYLFMLQARKEKIIDDAFNHVQGE